MILFQIKLRTMMLHRHVKPLYAFCNWCLNFWHKPKI